MRFSAIIFFLLLFTLIACQKKSVPIQSKTSVTTPFSPKVYTDSTKAKKYKSKVFPNTSLFTAFLNQNIKISDNEKLLIMQGDSIYMDSLTLNVYKANKFIGFWNDSAKCHEIIQALDESRFDGLSPKDYNVSQLNKLFKACFLGKKSRNDTIYWKLEITVTQNYLLYLNHLRFGKLNPATFIEDWDYKKDPDLLYSPEQLAQFLPQNPITLISEFRPQIPMYNVLRSVLYRVDSIGNNNTFEWDKIPYIGRDLKLNDTSWVIEKIKFRLLPAITIEENNFTNVFDEELLKALNDFQKYVGMTPNGKIDKTTITKLNFTLQQTEDLVRVNMERCRWLLIKGKLPDYFIVVNVANYSLKIFKNNKPVYSTKVVVGSTDKETPLFHSKMTTIEFNPYWTVPVGISKDEILPHLKTDPKYLERNNMELLKGDSVVYVTDFSACSKNYFPYVIRQKPGANNALGVVKFLFPNPYFIYFHDTPSKSHFSKDVRAMSHGCVRVQKPIGLAEFLLADQGFTAKQIGEIIKSGENTAIALKTRIPVIITYWTCFTDSKNRVYFLKDIYGRDKIILDKLNN
jgi:murein L,D-transpeptidase YcbB/YkuD